MDFCNLKDCLTFEEIVRKTCCTRKMEIDFSPNWYRPA